MQNEWIDKYIKQYVYYTCPTGLINTTSSLPPPKKKKCYQEMETKYPDC